MKANGRSTKYRILGYFLISMVSASCGSKAAVPAATISPDHLAGPSNDDGVTHAEAQDVWIHAVGIDQRETSQNLDSFYQGATDFISRCKTSSRKPKCHLLINQDPALAASSSTDVSGLQASEGAATPQKLLSAFSSAVQNARAPDQIILSLEDHGSPSPSLDGHSCIYFDGEPLCDSDLEPVVKKAHSGVTVIISADGCYSGAFANLAKAGACVMTGSDQLHEGISDRPSFWWLTGLKPVASFDQLLVPTEGGGVPRAASQLIMRSLCKSSRFLLGDHANAFAQFAEFGKLRVVKNYSSPPDRIYKYKEIAPVLGIIADTLSQVSCESAKLPAAACEAKKRIEALSSEQRALFFLSIDKSFSDAFRFKGEQEQLTTTKTKGLDRNVILAIKQIVDIGADLKTFKDWPPDKLSVIKRVSTELRPIKANLLTKEAAAWAQAVKALQDFQNTPTYQDWLDVYECFLPDKFDDVKVGYGLIDDSSFWDDMARRSKPLQFSNEDYVTAKTCESKIRF